MEEKPQWLEFSVASDLPGSAGASPNSLDAACRSEPSNPDSASGKRLFRGRVHRVAAVQERLKRLDADGTDGGAGVFAEANSGLGVAESETKFNR